MTSDIVQYIHSTSINTVFPKEIHTNISNISKDLELARTKLFLNETNKLFNALKNHNHEKNGLKRSINTTITLLKQAQNIIDNAEEKIKDQHIHIQNLKKLTTTDELSALNNRHGLFREMQREAARMQRNEALDTLLIIIELDNGQSIKENNGLETHKAVIKLIAKILNSEARAMDVVSRLNCNEFVLMFPNTSIEEILIRAQQLTARLNKLSLIQNNQEININISVGLKSFGSNDIPEDIFPKESG